MSHAANLFIALQNLISALTDGDGKKYFPYVDQELGQLEAYTPGGRPPVSWPCVLIDIDNITYQPIGENAQTAIATVIFRLGFPPYSHSSNITPSDSRDKAIYYYQLEQILHQALQGKAPQLTVDDEDILADVFGHFQRTSASTEAREDLIRVRVITYTIAFEDYSTKHRLQLTPSAINLTTTFDTD